MDRRVISWLRAMLILGLMAGKASANGFRLADQDAFATARGEAFVATADNASAVYYNPAGITQLQGNNIRSGLYGIYLNPTFTPPSGKSNSGRTYTIDDHYAAVPQFFYTCTPNGWPVSFGLGIYVPYGGKVNWPDDTGFRTVGTRGVLQYFTFNPVVAVKVLPSLSLAAGAMANYGQIDLEQGLRPGFAPPQTNFFRFKGCGWSAGFNVGARWQPLDELSFGATLRSSATMTMEGHTEVEQFPAIPRSTTLPADADFSFPLTAVIGVSYRPTPKWNLEIDADYTDWSSIGTVTINQHGTPPNGVKPNPVLTLQWKPSWLYEAGVTRFFENGWHVSAGYVYNENSIPDKYYVPQVPDMDRHFLSTGAGYRGKRISFDMTYQFGYASPRTVSGSVSASQPGQGAPTSQTADGKYGFISHAVMVTVGLNF